MAHFFTPYPLVAYDPTGQNRPTLAVDITRRFAISKVVLNASLVYYDYEIKENDRPDIMAHKYYKNPKLDWLFFITNNIFDPYFQWPLNYLQFQNYVRQKYGSVVDAQNQIHHYEQIVTQRRERVEQDGTVINIPERVIQIDETTYNTLSPTDRRSVTMYDYEDQLNEGHRKIKILAKDFLPEILQSFQDVFK